MENDWTEKYDRVCRDLADAKSANAAMRDNVDEKGAMIEGLISENATLCDDNMRLRVELGRLRGAYKTAIRTANENRKIGSVILK